MAYENIIESKLTALYESEQSNILEIKMQLSDTSQTDMIFTRDMKRYINRNPSLLKALEDDGSNFKVWLTPASAVLAACRPTYTKQPFFNTITLLPTHYLARMLIGFGQDADEDRLTISMLNRLKIQRDDLDLADNAAYMLKFLK